MFCDSGTQKELEFRPGKILQDQNANVFINTDGSKRCYITGESSTKRPRFRSRVLLNNKVTDHLTCSGASRRSKKITCSHVSWLDFFPLFSCFQCFNTDIINRLFHVTEQPKKFGMGFKVFEIYILSQEFHLMK